MYENYDLSFPTGQPAETIGEYTGKTFLWMTLGLMITFAVAIACWFTQAFVLLSVLQLPVLIVTLVLSFTMASRIERMSVNAAKGIFVAFSVLMGLSMALVLPQFRLSSLVLVFFATALYFALFGLYGYFTHRDLSGLRGILFSGLIFLILFHLFSRFIPGLAAFDRFVCLIGIAVFLAYTAYDTQKIRAYYHYYAGFPDMLEKASVFSALQLYLDFLNLFLYLLRFLGRSRD